MRGQKGSPFTTRGTEEGKRGEQPGERMDGWVRRGREVCMCVCLRGFEKEGGRERGMCAAGLVKDDNSPLSLLERPAGPSGVRCQPGPTVCVCVCVGTHACICMSVCVLACVLLSVAAFDC